VAAIVRVSAYRLQARLAYRWRKQLLACAEAVFRPEQKAGPDLKVEKLEAEDRANRPYGESSSPQGGRCRPPADSGNRY